MSYSAEKDIKRELWLAKTALQKAKQLKAIKRNKKNKSISSEQVLKSYLG